MTYLNNSNKTVSENSVISGYVIGWFVNYCAVDAYFMLQDIVIF